jgi:hypothetical protein
VETLQLENPQMSHMVTQPPRIADDPR